MKNTNSKGAAEQHAMIGVGNDFSGGTEMPPGFHPNRSPGTQWFPEAGLGLFLHFGTSAVHGLTDSSWGMIVGTNYDTDIPGQPSPHKMSPNRYFSYASQFNPLQWNPDALLKKAADAGFRYAVLTTKHHEGYTLWPSKHGDFGVQTYLNGRDLVRPFVEACRRNGLRVGLYFSPPDWHYNRDYMSYHYRSETKPDGIHFGLDHEPISLKTPPAGWQKKFRTMVRGQIEELLTQYGPIDLLWFDGKPEVISFEELRALQPDMLVNGRMHGYGDIITPECRVPAEPPPDWWELCDTTDKNGRWGYFKNAKLWSPEHLLTRLALVRSMGGNYLLNFSPNADGVLTSEAEQLMDQLKAWIDEHREALFGTQPGLYPHRSPVPDTIRDDRHFLFLSPEWKDEEVILKTDEIPASVTLNGVALTWKRHAEQLHVAVPRALRSETVDVVEMRIKSRA